MPTIFKQYPTTAVAPTMMENPFSDYSGSETRIRINPSVTSIPDHAFQGNVDLVEVELPDSIQSIGREAFYGCSSLKRIHLCEGLRTIDDMAFAACKSLSQVTISIQCQHRWYLCIFSLYFIEGSSPL